MLLLLLHEEKTGGHIKSDRWFLVDTGRDRC